MRFRTVVFLLFFAVGNAFSQNSQPVEVLVGAASSLRETMTAVSSAFEGKHPKVTIKLTFASSGILLNQVKRGAPLDVLACASQQEVNELESLGLVNRNNSRNFVRNQLVLISRVNSPIYSVIDLAHANRIAISNPRLVPSGRYAEQVLLKFNLSKILSDKLVYGENVRQVLTYVESGDVDAGFVYATDALTSSKTIVVWRAKPGKDCDQIIYRAGVASRSGHQSESQMFLNFLLSAEAQGIFRKYGFLPPPGPRRSSPPR